MIKYKLQIIGSGHQVEIKELSIFNKRKYATLPVHTQRYKEDGRIPQRDKFLTRYLWTFKSPWRISFTIILLIIIIIFFKNK